MDGLNILFEDNHLLVVNKNPGILVQNDKTGDISLLDLCKQYIKKKYNKKSNVFLGLVHRIDRPVSGTIIFAKSSKSLSRLNNQFKLRDVKKTYWAIVENAPHKAHGNLEHYLIKNQQKNKSHAYLKPHTGALKAVLNYKTLKHLDRYTLLEINPISGRHHQIRVQLSTINSIIKGDLKYGAKRSNKDASICLHAREINFVHPVKKEVIKICAPPPKNPIWEACL